MYTEIKNLEDAYKAMGIDRSAIVITGMPEPMQKA